MVLKNYRKDMVKKFLLVIIIGASVFFGSKLFIHNKYDHPQSFSNPAIKDLLKDSKVNSIEPMRDFLTRNGKKCEFEGEVFLVTLENGVKAVFKSLPLDDQADAQAEVAAYEASLFLGFPYIPPTVLREINGMKGSLQLFVDTPIDLLDDNSYNEVLAKVKEEDLAALKIFYFIFGQWDTGPHNLLAYSDEKNTYLVAIDNSAIRNRQHVKYGDLPFVRILYSDTLKTKDEDQTFPFKDFKIISKPFKENLRKIFLSRLPESFYNNFKSYAEKVKIIAYNNALWVQYHAFDKDFVKSYVEKCPQQILEAIKKLDMSALKQIFNIAKGEDFLNDAYLSSILDRRNQVLNYFEK